MSFTQIYFLSNFVGKMVLDPENAKSDKKQQITPDEFNKLVQNLTIRKKLVNDDSVKNTLEELRMQIDNSDNEIISILGARMNISKAIGKLKRENDITILQSNRWDNIIKKSIETGKNNGLSEDFISKVFKAIHQESINNQTKIMNDK